MQGKIVKGISGFYYVHVAGTGIYECKAKGIFRNQKIKPLVGDDVEIVVLDEQKKIGNVESILTRKNALIRPAVANIDMALVIFAAAKPDPNFNLLAQLGKRTGHVAPSFQLCSFTVFKCSSHN